MQSKPEKNIASVQKGPITIVMILAAVLLMGISTVMGQTNTCSHLLWSEEFNNEGAPDPAKWTYNTGGGGWGNNEVQTYTNTRNNSYVSDGTLKIHARKSQTGQWTSARLLTSGRASWKYGRFEIRAKLPGGRGTWPAIWMMPQNSVYGGWPRSGEIDIMEHVGYDMNKVHGTIHTESYNHNKGTQKGASIMLADVTSRFYVYTLEWTESEMRWYVDNIHFYTFKNENNTYREWPFDQPFFLIMNIAIGGNWGGAQGIDPALTEAVMEVDYIRVYGSPYFKPVISGPDTVEPEGRLTLSTPSVENVHYRWNLPEGVEPISDKNSNSIDIKWNNKAGTVTVDMYTECDTLSSEPFYIAPSVTPSGEFWKIPFTDQEGNILWKTAPGTGNQIDIGMTDSNLVVNYNIQSNLTNPTIYLDLPYTTNFSRHREMLLQIKALEGQMPANVRIDLVDNNMQIDSNNLFRIDGENGTGEFKTYSKLFTTGSGAWQLSRINRVRILFNYGVSGRKGSGQFVLSDMRMKDPTYTNTPITEILSGLTVYPNPVNTRLQINSLRAFNTVILSSLSGNIIKTENFPERLTGELDCTDLRPGFYILTVKGRNGWSEHLRIFKN